MRVSLQQKEQFFHELSSGLTAGLPFREVLERGAARRSQSKRMLCKALLTGMETGDGSASSGFQSVSDLLDPLDISLAEAGEVSGRLDAVCRSLAEYYGQLSKAKRAMLNQLAYPVFLLHFAIFILAAPVAVTEGVEAYLRSVLIALGVLYGASLILGAIVVFVLRTLKSSAWMERVVRIIPLFGGVRKALVCNRFAMVVSMQVSAGAGILSAFQRGGEASGSALFRIGCERVVAMVRAGESLPVALAEAACFPEEIVEAVQNADASGRLDTEMQRVAAVFQNRFTSGLDALAAWVPRLIYLAVMAFVAVKIIEVAKGYLGTVEQLLQ